MGNTTALTAGPWNTVTIPSVTVTAGTASWIAILRTGETLHFREGCKSRRSGPIANSHKGVLLPDETSSFGLAPPTTSTTSVVQPEGELAESALIGLPIQPHKRNLESLDD
jgi:hypothetical protein